MITFNKPTKEYHSISKGHKNEWEIHVQYNSAFTNSYMSKFHNFSVLATFVTPQLIVTEFNSMVQSNIDKYM